MKSVLISIQPKWVEKIASGEKTIEVRKSRPKLETPFKVYIYCTKSKKHFLQSKDNMFFYCEESDFIGKHGAGLYQRLNGKVIGEFVCDNVDEYGANCYGWYIYPMDETCLWADEIAGYGQGKPLYGWHITDLKIYDKPKELKEFWTVKCTNKKGGCIGCEVKPNCIKTITRPPQSYMFVEELQNG